MCCMIYIFSVLFHSYLFYLILILRVAKLFLFGRGVWASVACAFHARGRFYSFTFSARSDLLLLLHHNLYVASERILITYIKWNAQQSILLKSCNHHTFSAQIDLLFLHHNLYIVWKKEKINNSKYMINEMLKQCILLKLVQTLNPIYL